MCWNQFFFVGFCVLVAIAHEAADHDKEYKGGRLNAFLEILENEKVNDTQRVGVGLLEEFIGQLSQRVKCNETRNNSLQTGGQCLHTLCLNSSDLVGLAGGDVQVGVTEEQFANVSIVLLYVITQINNVCQTYADLTTLTLDVARDHLVSLGGGAPGHPHLYEADVSRLLDSFKPSLSHDVHDHADDHHHDDHHHDDHQDENSTEGHAHEDHAHEVHDHGDHAHEGHHHEDHAHEGHDHEDDNQALIIKDKCLSADALMYFMDLDHSVDVDEIGRLATLIVFFVYKGYEVQDKCRLLPHKDEFLNNLFSTFALPGKNMSAQDFIKLMSSLGINPEAEAHDDHPHEESHVHSQRKRSLGNGLEARREGRNLVSRNRRQIANQANMKQCYTASQIMAIYDSQGEIDQALLQEMCPSLLSQKMFGDCTHKDTSIKQESTMAERYGYSTIATAIICLFSAFGAIFIPCVSKTVYDILMALFVGLAVGTLFSDAVLHLIPAALGVHGHDEEHDHGHGNEIVVDTYIFYGLVIMAGLYFFYIVETFMSKLGGHSHSHDSDGSDVMICPSPENHAMTTFDDESKIAKDKSEKNYVVHADRPGILPDQKPVKKTCGLTPVALMIILGDGIHNFADGLAIGASFTSGIAPGLATSIAVVCHEIPHELGDFAVLLESGLSLKKALILNLASSLTAFAGLYVSLSVTTGEDAQKWIFAVTAGMFLYIALVDLLPSLIKTSGWLSLAINNIGILFGFAFMLLLAIFEEWITV